MKIVKLHEISASKGYDLDLNSKEDWLMELFKNLLGEHRLDLDSIKGHIKLRKTNELVDIIGNLTFTLHPECVRCCREFQWSPKLHFQVHMAPLPEINHSKKSDDAEEELELNDDDLNFSYYKNDEIQLDTIINDEIALEVPINFYCNDKLKCELKTPKNQHITVNAPEEIDPRWLPLKNLKNLKN